MNTRTRSAFTLIELLIVFAILAFLIGLLLPLVQRIRASAARMESQNNLKQIGLACHSRADAFKVLPPGVDDKGFSAAAYLLPFIEQDNLFKQINFNTPARANEAMAKIHVKVYQSPLDPLSGQGGNTAPTNYLFCAGTEYALEKNNGMYFKDSKVRFTDVTDGLSNTFMAGETLIGDGGKQAKTVLRQHVQLDPMDLNNLNDNSGVQEFQNNKKIVGDRGHSWIEGKFLYGTFNGRHTINSSSPDVSCGGVGGLSALRSTQKGASILMGDGSVRFVAEGVDLNTWRAMCTRNGGEVVAIP
jgi:type II secretory pathway pseudopilin PulG